ncbi:hypothetical protein EV421DRAFT_1813155 [Armillaria borealis]|uniref:Uncharacterized protein n=1 Tax=Armillaria borealis TaxID=47425 RepID=A0AA39JET2_9AGAR|nr:hypothetical protein EV421DRAFT_1813155 [Armillaria borealis]
MHNLRFVSAYKVGCKESQRRLDCPHREGPSPSVMRTHSGFPGHSKLRVSIYKLTLRSGALWSPMPIETAVQLKPSSEVAYRECHASVWPGVPVALERSHIADYSFYFCALQLLIVNMKYTGTDYEVDMKKVGEDPETQRWRQRPMGCRRV